MKTSPMGDFKNEKLITGEQMAYGRAIESKPITKAALLDYLIESGKMGATILSMTTVTQTVKPTRNKPSIWKVSQINGQLNVNYENAVNNRREKEGKDPDFVAAERQWGEHITSGVIENKGQKYIQVIIQGTRDPLYVIGEFSAEMRYADKSEIEQFLPKPAVSSRQDLEKERIIRDYKVDSIASITIKGMEFFVEDLDDTRSAVLRIAHKLGV